MCGASSASRARAIRWCSCTGSRSAPSSTARCCPCSPSAGCAGSPSTFPASGWPRSREDFDYSWSGLGRWTGAGDRRPRDRALPPRPPRHRRADRARVGAPQPRPGQHPDGARHPDRRRPLPPRLDDGPGGAARCSGRSGWRRSGRRSRAGSSTCRGSPTAPPPRPTRSTPTSPCCTATTAGAPSGRSSAASSSPRRRSASTPRGFARRAGPRPILWAERDPALGEDRRRAFEDASASRRQVISAKHFLQEDRAQTVADTIAELAGSG